MKIEVEDRHIASGVPMNPYFCAVAMAIQPHFPDYRVAVGEDTIDLQLRESPWGVVRRWETPPEVANFVLGFDEAGGPEGFAGFEFDLPD